MLNCRPVHVFALTEIYRGKLYTYKCFKYKFEWMDVNRQIFIYLKIGDLHQTKQFLSIYINYKEFDPLTKQRKIRDCYTTYLILHYLWNPRHHLPIYYLFIRLESMYIKTPTSASSIRQTVILICNTTDTLLVVIFAHYENKFHQCFCACTTCYTPT